MARMKAMHGVCLHPGRALVKLKVRAYNRTPFVQTFLWWANVATRVHEGYQSFFPPDVYCWGEPNDALNWHANQIRRPAAECRVGLMDSFAAFLVTLKAGARLEDLMAQSNHPNRRGHVLVADELLRWFLQK